MMIAPDVVLHWLNSYEKLREKFGSRVIIREVALCYDNNSGLVVSKYEGRPETSIVVLNINHRFDLSLKPSEFPEERWVLEMFGLLFNLDEKPIRPI